MFWIQLVFIKKINANSYVGISIKHVKLLTSLLLL